MRFHRYRRVIAMASFSVLTIGLAGYGVVDAAASPSLAGSRVAVPGTVPTWAQPAHATGTPGATERITVNVGLALRDPAGARRLALSVSDPHSADYGHYLTPTAFNAAYAPTAATVATVREFLTESGLSVGPVADGNRWITATGSISAVEKAFGTTVRTYTWKGRTLRAPSSDISVPAAIAANVVTVTGLDSSGLLRHPFNQRVPADQPPVRAPRGATPPAPSACSAYWGQHTQKAPAAYGSTKFPTYTCGYTPKQLRGAYGVDSAVKYGRNGHGVRVAIIDAYASPTMLADANAYALAVGDPKFGKGQYTETVFKPFTLQDECGESGWNSEETLDVEAVHGLAPGASVHYFGAANCDTGIDAAFNAVVQHHSADIISNSYGYVGEDVPLATQALNESLFVQAAAEGIGVYFSSGDSGDEVTIGNTTAAQPDYPASSPMVTAVGGTSLAVTKSAGYKFETGWGSARDVIDYSGSSAVYTEPLPGGFIFGGGGGTSMKFAQPAYQAGTVPDGLSRMFGGPRARVVPDVAAVGDPYTGFLIAQTINGSLVFGSIGGTSLACPVVAGIQALASTGRHAPIGFANPLLYSLSSSAFRDVKPRRTPIAVVSPSGGSLTTFDRDSTLGTFYGYDNVTGRGTPRGASFLAAER